MKRLLALAALIFATPALSASYYVDCAASNDKGAGTSPETAWQTIDRVNRSNFQPGDSILFKRGCTWWEQLTVPSSGAAGRPITFGAYGTGNDPVFNESTLIVPGPSWRAELGGHRNVWNAVVTTEPEIVVFDSTHVGNRETSNADLAKEFDWHWELGTLSVYSTTDPDLAYSSPGVEAGARSRGLYGWHKNYVTVRHISVRNCNDQGIANFGGRDWTFDSVNIAYTQSEGIRNWGYDVTDNIDGLIVRNCNVSYTGDTGIYAGNYARGGRIENNIVHHCCWDAANFDTNAGIKIWGADLIGYTVTRNVSYKNGVASGVRGAGIWVDNTGGGHTVSHNHIHDNALMGIFIEKEHRSPDVISYNVVHDEAGAVDAYDGSGIRISDNVRGNLVYNNTIYNCRHGIAVFGTWPLVAESCTRNILKNNIVVGSTTTALVAIFGGENDGTNGSGNVYEYNCLGLEFAKFIEWGAGVKKSTHDTWERAYGGPTHSVRADPLLVNAANGDFTLQAWSPAIDAGEDLTSTYSTGLMPGTSWPSDVVTGDQYQEGSWWEIGAFLFPAGSNGNPTAAPFPRRRIGRSK